MGVINGDRPERIEIGPFAAEIVRFEAYDDWRGTLDGATWSISAGTYDEVERILKLLVATGAARVLEVAL